MKFSCTQENIKGALGNITSISGKNINLPILSNVLIKIDDGNIKLSATDLEMGATCSIRGKIEKKGSFTVNAKLLADYISLLPNNRIDFEVIENELLVKSDNYKTKIKGEGAEDFPIIPTVEKKELFVFNAVDFRDMLNDVIFAAARDETRIELSGVYFEFNGDGVTAAATDSYRLAEKIIKYKNKEGNGDIKKVIIPTKTLQEIIKVCSNEKIIEINGEKTKNDIKIYLSENQVLFSYNETEIISRIIEGQYPDYRQIIPNINKEDKTVIKINKKDLVRAIKASSLFSKSNINDIHLDFPVSQKKVIVSAVSGQGGESVVDVPADIIGKDNGITLNHRYLIDGLNNLDVEDVVLEVVDSNTPFTLKSGEDEKYLYIIMPIKQ
ncbi:MAG: DNA polymerase III subunit beta [Patescibacteria group bacterium]|jgi:DNA polymerase-3 subunit beta